MERTVVEIWHEQVGIGNVCSCLCTVYHNGKAKVMIVDDVRTEKKYRGCGYATKLMGMVYKLAKQLKVGSIELVVNKDNLVAQRLYEKAGFERTEKYHYRKILNKCLT